LLCSQPNIEVHYVLVPTGGIGPYKFELAGGETLPDYLALNSTTGIISGLTSAEGVYTKAINITDSVGNILPLSVVLNVSKDCDCATVGWLSSPQSTPITVEEGFFTSNTHTLLPKMYSE
jgi:hypothetical protein